MRDGSDLNRAPYRLLAVVLSLGILLASPMAGLTALAAPGGAVGVSDAATVDRRPALGALVGPQAVAGDGALGRVIDAGAPGAVLAQASADMTMTKTAPATITI